MDWAEWVQKIVWKAMGPSAEVRGFTLLSQGFATAPRGVVWYKRSHDLHPYVVHFVRFDQDGSMVNGSYLPTAQDAWLEFVRRVQRDMAYVNGGCPLTGEPQDG